MESNHESEFIFHLAANVDSYSDLLQMLKSKSQQIQILFQLRAHTVLYRARPLISPVTAQTADVWLCAWRRGGPERGSLGEPVISRQECC